MELRGSEILLSDELENLEELIRRQHAIVLVRMLRVTRIVEVRLAAAEQVVVGKLVCENRDRPRLMKTGTPTTYAQKLDMTGTINLRVTMPFCERSSEHPSIRPSEHLSSTESFPVSVWVRTADAAICSEQIYAPRRNEGPSPCERDIVANVM